MSKVNINFLRNKMKIKKAKDSYYEIKQMCKDLKENNLKKRIREEGKFEDVPKHISDKDAEGSFKRKPYMNFFQSVKYHFDQTLLTQPSGVTATNKNYDYANSKFIEQLD